MQKERLQQPMLQQQLRALQKRQQEQQEQQRALHKQKQDGTEEHEDITATHDGEKTVLSMHSTAHVGGTVCEQQQQQYDCGLLLLQCGGADDRRRAVDCVETFRLCPWTALQREEENSRSSHSTAASSPQTGSLSSSPASSLRQQQQQQTEQHQQQQQMQHHRSFSRPESHADKKGEAPSFLQVVEHLPPLQAPRYAHVACATSEDEVLVVGGREDDESVLRSVERFSFSQRTWSSLPSLHSARAHHAGCMVRGGGAVVIGGEGDRGRVLRSVEFFHPIRGNWINLPPLQHPRHSFAAVAVGCCIVVLGGRDEPGDHGRVLKSVEGFTLCGAASLSAATVAGSGAAAATAAVGSLATAAAAATEGSDSRSGNSRCLTTTEQQQQQTETAASAVLVPAGAAKEATKAAADAVANTEVEAPAGAAVSVGVQQQQQQRQRQQESGLRGWACTRTQSESDPAAATSGGRARLPGVFPAGTAGDTASSGPAARSCGCSNRSSMESCWRLLPSMRQARASCGAAQYESFIFCAGGTNGVKPLASVELFDTRTGIWSNLPPLNEARVSPLCFVWRCHGESPLLPLRHKTALQEQQEQQIAPHEEDEGDEETSGISQQKDSMASFPVLCVAGGRRSTLNGVLSSVEFLDLRPYLPPQQDVYGYPSTVGETSRQQQFQFGDNEGDETSSAPWVFVPDAGATLLWQSAAALLLARDTVEREAMEPAMCPSLEILAAIDGGGSSTAAKATTTTGGGGRRTPGGFFSFSSSEGLLFPVLTRPHSASLCGSTGCNATTNGGPIRHPLTQPGIRRTLPHTITGTGTTSSGSSSGSTCGASAGAAAAQRGNALAALPSRRVSFTSDGTVALQAPYGRSHSSNDSTASRGGVAGSAADPPIRRSFTSHATGATVAAAATPRVMVKRGGVVTPAAAHRTAHASSRAVATVAAARADACVADRCRTVVEASAPDRLISAIKRGVGSSCGKASDDGSNPAAEASAAPVTAGAAAASVAAASVEGAIAPDKAPITVMGGQSSHEREAGSQQHHRATRRKEEHVEASTSSSSSRAPHQQRPQLSRISGRCSTYAGGGALLLRNNNSSRKEFLTQHIDPERQTSRVQMLRQKLEEAQQVHRVTDPPPAAANRSRAVAAASGVKQGGSYTTEEDTATENEAPLTGDPLSWLAQ